MVITLTKHKPGGGDRLRIAEDVAALANCSPAGDERVQGSVMSTDGSPWSLVERHTTAARLAAMPTLSDVATVQAGTTGFTARRLLPAIREDDGHPDAVPFIVTGNIDPYVIRKPKSSLPQAEFQSSRA